MSAADKGGSVVGIHPCTCLVHECPNERQCFRDVVHGTNAERAAIVAWLRSQRTRRDGFRHVDDLADEIEFEAHVAWWHIARALTPKDEPHDAR